MDLKFSMTRASAGDQLVHLGYEETRCSEGEIRDPFVITYKEPMKMTFVDVAGCSGFDLLDVTLGNGWKDGKHVANPDQGEGC
jgi:hypothetical protein